MGLNPTEMNPKSALPPAVVDPRVAYRLQPWYEAYMVALFESDRGRVAERIKQAEQLIVNREREIRSHRSDLNERRALNHALHALHALSGCFKP